MGVSNMNYHIQIKSQMPDLSQEPPASSKAPTKDSNDMDGLCTFKIKTESQILDQECIKDWWQYLNYNQDAKPQPGSSSILQSTESGLNPDIDILCTSKIKIESRNSDHGCIKVQWPYPNLDWDTKPQSGASSVLQSPKSGLKGHGYSLHL